jgi:D-alanyl-D-alanine carboxypeptidase/D-alanyl-D-alanine-endopeptidase (penicillin-binding protein 4)
MSTLHRNFTGGITALAISISACLLHAQVAAPQVAASSAAVATAAPSSNLRLQSLVEQVIREAALPATVAVYVQDSDGKAAADINGTKPVIPASNNKLVTTAAGLTLQGPDFHFDTKFLAGGPVQDGVLNGDLVVFGGGDPGIGGRYQKDPSDITALFRQWATKLKGAGIKSIAGNIVADDSYFDDVYFHPKWYPGERGEWYEAEVSALAFNDNCIDIMWSGKGLLPDQPAAYTLSPKTGYVNFQSEVKTVAAGRPTERYYARGAADNNIKATGNLNIETTNPDSAAIHDGALYCVTVLTDVLKAEGIAVSGKPAKQRGAAQKLPASSLLFTHQSVPLLQVCQTINLNSQNFYAECVAKALGRVRAGNGSWEAGCKVIEDFCKSHGIFSEGHHAADGSGLSDENHVTCKQLVSILQYMDNSNLKQQWRSTLPQGQKRGSLKPRFDNIPEASRIFGKTGSIGGVRSLSGYVIDAAGREVYYSIVLNDLPNAQVSKGMALIDKIAVELAKSK